MPATRPRPPTPPTRPIQRHVNAGPVVPLPPARPSHSIARSLELLPWASRATVRWRQRYRLSVPTESQTFPPAISNGIDNESPPRSLSLVLVSNRQRYELGNWSSESCQRCEFGDRFGDSCLGCLKCHHSGKSIFSWHCSNDSSQWPLAWRKPFICDEHQ